MTFTWTPPDPLNNTAKTKSIYMTELQTAANVRRVEIAQSQLSFINQNIGQKFVLSAIEELKTVVNQLSIDFGYSLGVEDPNLLGRPYVTITKKYGKTVCHYPILNDLRTVLNALESSFTLILPVSYNRWAIASEYNGSDMKIKNLVSHGWGYLSEVFWGLVNFSELYYNSGAIYITKINKDTGDATYGWDVGDTIRHNYGKDICVGKQGSNVAYQYVLGTPLSGGNNKIIRYEDIITSNLIATDIFDLGTNYVGSSITNNENFVFVGGKDYAGIPSYYNASICKLLKGTIMSLANKNDFYLDLITPPGGVTITKKQANISALTIDDSYIYCFYQESLYYKIPPSPLEYSIEKSALIKLTVSGLVPSVLEVADNIVDFGVSGGMTVQGNYLYLIHAPAINTLIIRNKASGTYITTFYGLWLIDGSEYIEFNSSANAITSKQEYLIANPS